MAKVVTFGEIMLRLSPEGYLRFGQTDRYNATFGGAEANVAVSLANYGIDADFVSKLPKNPIADSCVRELKKYSVGTDNIIRGGDRVGMYYLEKGASQRASQVVYDRAYSAISQSSPDEYDWKKILSGANWFHFTGITPALSDNMSKACIEACKEAKMQGLTVSCDLNYRKKLWSKEEANRVMSKLAEYIDICIANEEDAADVFGITSKDTDPISGKLNHSGYRVVAEKLCLEYGFKKTAITLRTSVDASVNKWAAMLYDNGEAYYSRTYTMHIVDRVGGGDSFGAGLIYSLINEMSPQEAIEFAAAASCLKHSVEGDFNLVTADEVKKLASGDGSGRVSR